MPGGNSEIILDPKSKTRLVYERSTGDVVLYRRNSEVLRLTASTLDLAGSLARSELATETKVYPVPLTELRVWDARATNLPATAANDDMGLVTGTFGTDSPTLQGVDFGGATSDEMGAFQFRLPPEYVAGGSVVVRLRAGMLTTVPDTSATVDVACHKTSRSGAVGSDLCATAAQGIESLTLADKNFTITSAGLSPGDLLDIRLAFAGTDLTDAGVMVPVIGQVELVLEVKG